METLNTIIQYANAIVLLFALMFIGDFWDDWDD